MPRFIDRRDFLKTSTVAAAALSTASLRAAGANERIRIGFIGPGGRGFSAHVRNLSQMQKNGANIELAAVAEVYSVQRDKVADFITQEHGNKPGRYVDYRDMFEEEELDAVCIGTPDHWHHKQIIDSLNKGLHVYCEKPMTKSVEEAMDVVKTWKKSGKVMQVGVQSASDPMLIRAKEMMDDGKLGKVLMFQTEYFRNSSMGQWRYYPLTKEMTPQTVDWKRWLGTEEGLAEDRPFDREIYAQWRRFWPFGSGMFTDLFVHRVTAMLKATGLSYPGRVVGAGGIYLEYDGRDVPDVATVVADYPEGVQGVVSSTMCCAETPIQQVIRGHFGSFIFEGNKIRFVAERPQVTRNSRIQDEVIEFEPYGDGTDKHFKNWLDAIEAGDPMACSNPPDLGAAAVTTVLLGAQSYRNGVCYYFDQERGPFNAFEAHQKGESWAKQWEDLSARRGQPRHIPGWKAGDLGSTLETPSYMSLAGPWIDNQPPQQS